jgi:hypothetical protein
VVIVCTVLTFVRWRWVHPIRVQSLWPVTLGLTLLWLVAALWTVVQACRQRDATGCSR